MDTSRSVGIFLVLLSLAFASAANRQTPALAPGLLVCGILFLLASTRAARKWKFLPAALILAGVVSCGLMMINHAR